VMRRPLGLVPVVGMGIDQVFLIGGLIRQQRIVGSLRVHPSTVSYPPGASSTGPR